MSKVTAAALLQVLGILLIALAVVQKLRSGAALAGPGIAGLAWLPGILFLGLGTLLRIRGADAERAARRTLIKPRFATAVAQSSTQAGNATADDLSRAITPAMLEELEASGPWMTGFSLFIGVSAVALLIGGSFTMFGGIVGGTRLALVSGFGLGIAQLLLGSLELMLFSYVRQHRRAIAAAGGRLTEAKLIAIIDTQRRIWRFFGTMLSFLGVLVVLVIAGALLVASIRSFL